MEFTEGVRFDSLGLSPEIMRAIEQRKIEVSTPVQAGCIPPLMDWKDVVAKAPTGTGKTFFAQQGDKNILFRRANDSIFVRYGI